MLVTNVNGEAKSASMVKDSKFYIEIAKFVQAYTTIIENPNEFLSEIGEPSISESDRLSWAQFVSIVKKCDLGFKPIPTETDLIVYYNYAVEIGTIDDSQKRLATVGDVADAQKHYYNFIDEATTRAEQEYLKQHRITTNRNNELNHIDNQLSALKAGSIFGFALMMMAVFIVTFGIVSMLYANVVVNTIGGVFSKTNAQYIGSVILIIIGIILFIAFDCMYRHFKVKYTRLKIATKVIFERGEDTYNTEINLKRKFDEYKVQLKIVKSELNDKKRTYDVIHNIEVLRATNKYYSKLCTEELELAGDAPVQEDDNLNMSVEEFAPVKLTKEQQENLRTVTKEAISLEGQIDKEAYYEKFEKSKAEKQAEKQQDNKENEQEDKELKDQEKEQAKLEDDLKKQSEKQAEEDLMKSIDMIKDILGFTGEEIQKD